MKVPYSWLKEYLDIELTPEELGERLVKSGFEVEGIEDLGNGIQNVKTARITKITKHPDADRLQCCEIDLGDEQTMIITAATNVFEGAIVPAALDGARLFGGKRIFRAPLRGIDSNGMFCSGAELGIDDSVIVGAEADGILILPPDTPLGKDIKDVLGMNEKVLDISVTSNRPDCQSILGIAKEASAILGVPLKMPNLAYKTEEGNPAEYVSVDVRAPELCTHYYGSVVKNVTISESPKWMRDRLRAVGIRSINTIVDITNYVLTEIGQPMHAFDYREIRGGKIIVRRAADGEKLITLDEKEFELRSSDLIIADAEGAIGLAGIMGGQNSEIKQDTATVVFEAARFARGGIRRTSRALGQRSASSARFERGVDLGTTTLGMERALALVGELGCGTIVSGKVKFESKPVERRTIEVDLKRVWALLGIEIPASDVRRIFEGLEIEIVKEEGTILLLKLPLQREDLENYTDIAEELIRIYGYDHIRSSLPKTETETVSYDAAETDRIKQTLVGLGCFEAATYSFVNPVVYDMLNLPADDPRRKGIVLRNPISEEYSVMRTTMAPNVLTCAALNLNRKNASFRLFEISRVFLPKSDPLGEGPEERTHLTVCVCGSNESFFTLKGILNEVAADCSVKFGVAESAEPFLHPGRAADILVKGKKVGYFGAVHPIVAERFGIEEEVLFAELNLDALTASPRKTVRFVPLPKYQEIERDLALTVKDDVKAGDMTKAIARECGSKLESVTVFDVYKGEQIEKGCKSVAFKLTFRAPDRTLTDEEVAEIMTKLQSAMAAKFGSKIRM